LASPILNIEREEMIAPAADPEENSGKNFRKCKQTETKKL
jgi:hypothetical protein